METKNLCEEILQKNGYRVTRGRTKLLMFLRAAKKPLSAKEIHKGMNFHMDKVTLYRALEDFVVSKIITRVNLPGVSVYYEFVHADHHHHHIVCEHCGKIEDVENCSSDTLQRNILKSSRSFAQINSHSLEFFGICKTCA